MDPTSLPGWGYALQHSQGFRVQSTSQPFCKPWLTSTSGRTCSARQSALSPALSWAQSHPSHLLIEDMGTSGGCFTAALIEQPVAFPQPQQSMTSEKTSVQQSRVNQATLSSQTEADGKRCVPHALDSSCSHQQPHWQTKQLTTRNKYVQQWNCTDGKVLFYLWHCLGLFQH